MFKFKMKITMAAAVCMAMLLSATGSAHASTMATCPDNASLSRTFTLDPSTGCYAYGVGNINGNIGQDPILNGATTGGNTFNLGAGSTVIPGLVYLDASNATNGALNGAIGGAVDDAKSGTLTVTGTSAWTNLILAIKVGNGDPTWAAFNIAGDGSYAFTITPTQGSGLSHVMLYGVDGGGGGGGGPTVPLPASGLLLIGGLSGIAALRRRRRKQAV